MSRYDDIDPQDIDPDTGRPYSNYSSPSLDTRFHDDEAEIEEDDEAEEDEDDPAINCGAWSPAWEMRQEMLQLGGMDA